jgi:hypothetical protein
MALSTIRFNNLKGVIKMNKYGYTLGGAVVGAVLGYLIADYVIYVLEEKKAEAEFKNFVNEEGGRILAGDPEAEEPKEVINEITTSLNGSVPQTTRVDYGSKSKAALEELVQPYRNDDAPRITEFDEWIDAGRHYDRETIMYYEEDTTFCGEDEQIIDAPQNLFGPNIQLHFGEGNEDPDAVYVLNGGRGEAYEIVRMDGSYSVQVLGEIPEPPKPSKPVRNKRPGRPKGSKNKPKETDVDDQEIDSNE